jgi:phosphoglycolate phosphatase-like HAD superfamily hydrolase
MFAARAERETHCAGTSDERYPAVNRLVLFDIDGTLVLTGGAGVRAMTRAFEILFSIPDAFRHIPVAGRTDAAILADAAAAHGVNDRDLNRFPDVYFDYLVYELDQPGPRKGVLPGIPALLERLKSREEIYLALLTGNYERSARMKLEHFNLWRFFPCGAFGDDCRDRNALVAKALGRVRERGGPNVAPSQTVVIGDTPLDVACAAAAGVRSLAVATGGYDVAALRGAGADIVFEDLSDTEAVLKSILRAPPDGERVPRG